MKISNKDMIIVMALVKLPGECPYKKDGVLAVPSGGTTGLKNSTVGAFGVPFRVPKKTLPCPQSRILLPLNPLSLKGPPFDE